MLEGATDFSGFAFQQIDVYAAGLVVWEILTRTCVPEHPDGKYCFYNPVYISSSSSSSRNPARVRVAIRKRDWKNSNVRKTAGISCVAKV